MTKLLVESFHYNQVKLGCKELFGNDKTGHYNSDFVWGQIYDSILFVITVIVIAKFDNNWCWARKNS